MPKELVPIYEENVYNKLKQPLTFIKNYDDIDNLNINNDTDIAYIYQKNDKVFISGNIYDVVKDFDTDIINYTTQSYGKLVYKNRLYYYYHTYNANQEHVISITNDKYVNNMKREILYTILLVTGISFTLSSLIIISWSNNLVNDIIVLKKKIRNINNDNYNYVLNHDVDDEIKELDIEDNQVFRGTYDMWETIIDNLLNNFMRYAKKEIKITIKNHKITLYNDGENIDESIINNIFTPYEKGLNGMFGLGLSIIKKTLALLNYDITVSNVKDGVNFIIK